MHIPDQHPDTRKTSLEAVRRTKVRKVLDNHDAVYEILQMVAGGVKMREIAEHFGVDYAILHQMLKARHGERLQAARAAHAEDEVGKNLKLADGIQAGKVDATAGKAAAGIRQWYAERVASEDWGQRSSLDVNHRGVIGLHMDALRQFNEKPLEGEVEDAEFEEVDESTDDVDNHPLL